MKKKLFALLFLLTLILATGCSKSNNTSAIKTPGTDKTTTQSQSTNSTSEVKVTKDNAKSLNDDQLLKIAEEPAIDIDNLDLEVDDLSELDSILKDEDITSDIPTSVDLKK